MKIVGVIPARYASSRFPGKPLADICGKPMIWWVYEQAKRVEKLSEIVVATDDKRIADACKTYDIKYTMTSADCQTPTDRLIEVSDSVAADLYLCINGDEPLIDPDVISKIIPENYNNDEIFFSNIVTAIKDPVEVIDSTNIKTVSDINGNCIYMSRSPIPYPKSNMNFKYMKTVGIAVCNKKALNFYRATPRGPIELIEDGDMLRFIENQIYVKLVEADCKTLSVDTPKDLERVVEIISKRHTPPPEKHIT